jgi:hypothetical protein
MYKELFTELNKFVEEYRVIIMLKFYLMKYLSSQENKINKELPHVPDLISNIGCQTWSFDLF